jgi:hypothetical protein
MKTYIVVGIFRGVLYTLTPGGSMLSNIDLDPKQARHFRTMSGAYRYIEKETNAGTDWQLAVWEANK